MSGKYDDIIHLPRPVSQRHPPMPVSERAAQFSPFAALTGYDAAIDETARLTDAPVELAESRKLELNAKLQLLMENIARQPEVTVTFFVPDERKQGGSYVSRRCRIRRVDTHNRHILLSTGEQILFDRIVELEQPDY